jgi:hypothetical protein
MYHYPALIPHVRHSGRRAGPAQFAPQRHPQAHLPPVTPEMMKVHNRLWETILRHPNPIEAMNQCMELLTDDVEDFQRPQNEVEEEQNGREGGQQGGHVVGPEPGEDGGMPPQDPPPYQPHGGMPDYYEDLLGSGGHVSGIVPGGGMSAGLRPGMPPQYPGAGGGFSYAPPPYGRR